MAGVPLNYQNNQLILHHDQPLNLHLTYWDIANCLDLAPILLVFSLFLSGPFILDHVHNLMHKESNRIASMNRILEQLGRQIEYDPQLDCLKVIFDPQHQIPSHLVFSDQGDHRLYFALRVLQQLLPTHQIEIQSPNASFNKSASQAFDDFMAHLSPLTSEVPQ
jgi:3-phosphoshikimate 1-carboxyvinyltransferase